jgi:hypothetical protein
VEIGVGNPITPHVTGTTIVLSDLFAGACTSPESRANFASVTFGGSASVYITDPGFNPFTGMPLTNAQSACLRELRQRALDREGIDQALYRLPVEGATGLLDIERPDWRLGSPRAGELILTADNQYAFLVSLASSDAATPGVHGGAPARPIAFLVASGGTFLRAGLEQRLARPIDVAPTVAALLGVDPPTFSEGRVLREAFGPPGLIRRSR